MNEPMRITPQDIARTNEAFRKTRANTVAKNAVSAQGIRSVARVPEAVAQNTIEAFDIEVSQGKRCDQQRSGRCWMFASLNIFRASIMRKYDLKSFELSEAYPLFFDKLEKSGWFLQSIMDTLDKPLDGRLVSHLLADPISDGGQWDMFCGLVKKYGVVPKETMPETACSRNTHDMDKFLARYLRGCAKTLRGAHVEGSSAHDLNAMAKDMLGNVQSLLITCLGEPPTSFDVRLRNKDDELVLTGTFTPQEFYDEVVGIQLDDYVSVISAPTADKPFNHTYTVKYMGNVVEYGQVRYLNLEPAELKRMAIAQLRDGQPVWFGCDVDQCFLRDEGIMDPAALDVDSLFGFAIEGCLNKAERLDYGESILTHAMVLEGVNLNNAGDPVLWKVENSWGKDHGRNGFDTLSDAWFDEYVYQVVVNKRYLTDDQRHILQTEEPIELAPWDPLGSLA